MLFGQSMVMGILKGVMKMFEDKDGNNDMSPNLFLWVVIMLGFLVIAMIVL